MFKHVAAGARRRWPFLLFGGLVLSCVLSAGLWLGAASASSKHAQAFFNFNDKMTKFSAAESDNQACATAIDWTDIPSSTITFSLGGTTARHTLITVAFQSSLGAGGVGL